jgi:hypothetical protein
MHKEEGLTPAEQELESVLGQLKPAANTLNRDGLMFNAGRAAAGRKTPWQMLSGTLMVLLLCSVMIRSDMHGPQESAPPHDSGQFRMAQATYRPVQIESPRPLVYPTLRRNIVTHGLDALTLEQSTRGKTRHKNRKQWLDSMLSS